MSELESGTVLGDELGRESLSEIGHREAESIPNRIEGGHFGGALLCDAQQRQTTSIGKPLEVTAKRSLK
jgi:hypothetical protein